MLERLKPLVAMLNLVRHTLSDANVRIDRLRAHIERQERVLRAEQRANELLGTWVSKLTTQRDEARRAVVVLGQRVSHMGSPSGQWLAGFYGDDNLKLYASGVSGTCTSLRLHAKRMDYDEARSYVFGAPARRFIEPA